MKQRLTRGPRAVPTPPVDQRKTLGWVGTGCGSALVLLSLLSFAFFAYVGLEGRGNDEEIAFPAAGLSCCCSLSFLAIVGVGLYFALSSSKKA